MDRKSIFILIIFCLISSQAYCDITAITNPYTGKLDFMQNISSSAPENASSSCVPTTLAYDENYFYVCVGTNSWKRTALAVWAVTDFLLMSDGTSHILLSDGTSKILIRP